MAATEHVYADASALVKLVVDEAETRALRRYVEQTRPALASSAVVRVELTRAARIAAAPQAAGALRDVLDGLTLVALDTAVLELAATLTSRAVRSLDAIHLASALTLGAREMLVYDQRLAAAAATSGIRVISPGA